ncbi:MAG: 5-(carboxyamino)imidazole ribonucleotide synthase, partial [Chloroflexi bacterium]
MNVGIIGGGQLGRMLALAGYRLGMRFRILDPAADACAGHVAHLVCAGYDDRDAMTEFRHALDVVTYEFENVPVEAVAHLSERISVFPGVAALAAAQDRVAEKRLFTEVGLETAAYAP